MWDIDWLSASRYCSACPKLPCKPDRRRRQQPIGTERRCGADRRHHDEYVPLERRDPSFTTGPWWEVKTRQWLSEAVILGGNWGLLPRWLRRWITCRFLYRWYRP